MRQTAEPKQAVGEEREEEKARKEAERRSSFDGKSVTSMEESPVGALWWVWIPATGSHDCRSHLLLPPIRSCLLFLSRLSLPVYWLLVTLSLAFRLPCPTFREVR